MEEDIDTADHVWEFPLNPGLYWYNSIRKSGLIHIETGSSGCQSDNTKHIYRFRLFELINTCCSTSCQCNKEEDVYDLVEFFGKMYHRYRNNKKKEEEEERTCSICYTELPPLSTFRIVTSCSHGPAFHLSCMESWLATAANQGHDLSCPMCRKKWGWVLYHKNVDWHYMIQQTNMLQSAQDGVYPKQMLFPEGNFQFYRLVNKYYHDQ